jgi:hypothetical protein
LPPRHHLGRYGLCLAMLLQSCHSLDQPRLSSWLPNRANLEWYYLCDHFLPDWASINQWGMFDGLPIQ